VDFLIAALDNYNFGAVGLYLPDGNRLGRGRLQAVGSKQYAVYSKQYAVYTADCQLPTAD
jgi:hypothetical protein